MLVDNREGIIQANYDRHKDFFGKTMNNDRLALKDTTKQNIIHFIYEEFLYDYLDKNKLVDEVMKDLEEIRDENFRRI